MGAVSPLYATPTPTPNVIPVSNGSGNLDDWLSNPPLTNPMTTDQDLIVGGVGGTPGRLGVGAVGRVLTVGSGGIIDWETPSGGGSGSITLSGYTMATARILGRDTAGTGAIEELTQTGTGPVVRQTSPTLVTPALGTPSALVLTNATGLPVGGITGLGSNMATFLATPSSANLLATVTDETGTGALVFATSPTLVTPALGTPSAAVLTNATGLPVATGISGLGTGVATFLATPSSANLAAALTDETGSGAAVFATSPTLVTPSLGTPTALVLTNATGLPLTTGVTGILPVANGGTATATPALVAGTNVTITGTWPNQTINSTGGGVALWDSPTWTGIHTWTPTARSSGSAAYFTINSPADTAITAATEAIGINIPGSTRQHASNTVVPIQREIVIGGPVYSFATAGGVITEATTLSISAPTAGTNASITRRSAISIPDGGIAFGTLGSQGTITSGGATGNLALTAGGTNQNITINPSGTGIICYGTPSAVLPTAAMGVFGNSDQTARLFVRRASADIFSGGITFTKAEGSMASPSTCASGTVLGTIYWGGFDGTNWAENTCRMQVHTTEAWTTSAHGNEIRFYTDATGTTTVGLALTITQGGALKTAAPTSGTAAEWKHGIYVAGAPAATGYVQLDIGGTLYKLLTST